MFNGSFTTWQVQKIGDARIGLVGFPSVGKSSLLTALTGVQLGPQSIAPVELLLAQFFTGQKQLHTSAHLGMTESKEATW